MLSTQDDGAICLEAVQSNDAQRLQLPCECGVNDLCPQCRAPLPPGAKEFFYLLSSLRQHAPW
jgi:hypothetical protein